MKRSSRCVQFRSPRRPARKGFTFLALLPFVTAISVIAADATSPRRPAARGDAPARRMLWVTRWDFRSPRDVVRIFSNAAAIGFTDVMFQVRGEGTVFFESPHEPWAWELSGFGPERGVGLDPGWDPLGLALAEAKSRGLRVHAYVNVLPCWAQSVNPSRDTGQLYVGRRSWLMVDRRGRKMRSGGFYAFLDPGLPEVREYLANLFARLVADYPVDGLHLDYIRYPHEAGEFSYHPRVLKDFREWYGKTPDEAPETWNRYRRRQVTETVRAIRKAIDAVRPGIELSAAVVADPRIGWEKSMQEPLHWLSEGWVDAIAPMVYVEDMPRFAELMAPYADAAVRGRVWPGVRAMSGNDVFFAQVRRTEARGYGAIAVFSYQDLFPRHRPSGRASQLARLFASGGKEATNSSTRGPMRTYHKRRRPDLKFWVR